MLLVVRPVWVKVVVDDWVKLPLAEPDALPESLLVTAPPAAGTVEALELEEESAEELVPVVVEEPSSARVALSLLDEDRATLVKA